MYQIPIFQTILEPHLAGFAYLVFFFILKPILCTVALDTIYKKLSYRRGSMRHAILVNSCYVSQGMGVR